MGLLCRISDRDVLKFKFSSLLDNLCCEETFLVKDEIPSRHAKRKSFAAQCKKMALISYANREGPDQTAHLRSLIRAFSVRPYISLYPMIL